MGCVVGMPLPLPSPSSLVLACQKHGCTPATIATQRNVISTARTIVAEEAVGRLDIAVNNILSVEGLERVRQLNQVRPDHALPGAGVCVVGSR